MPSKSYPGPDQEQTIKNTQQTCLRALSTKTHEHAKTIIPHSQRVVLLDTKTHSAPNNPIASSKGNTFESKLQSESQFFHAKQYAHTNTHTNNSRGESAKLGTEIQPQPPCTAIDSPKKTSAKHFALSTLILSLLPISLLFAPLFDQLPSLCPCGLAIYPAHTPVWRVAAGEEGFAPCLKLRGFCLALHNPGGDTVVFGRF